MVYAYNFIRNEFDPRAQQSSNRAADLVRLTIARHQPKKRRRKGVLRILFHHHHTVNRRQSPANLVGGGNASYAAAEYND